MRSQLGSKRRGLPKDLPKPEKDVCKNCRYCRKQEIVSRFMYYRSDGHGGLEKVYSEPKLKGICIRFPKWEIVFSKEHFCAEFEVYR